MPIAFRRRFGLRKTSRLASGRKTATHRSFGVKAVASVKRRFRKKKDDVVVVESRKDKMTVKSRRSRKDKMKRKESRGYANRRPDIFMAPLMSMVEPAKGPIGGKVVRTYTLPLNSFNLGASSTSLGIGLSIANAAGVLTLNAYAGRAISGTGTLLGSFGQFTAEAGHLCDTFKWMKVNRIQLNAFPVTNSIQGSSTNITDESVLSDGGVCYVSRWNGDDSLNSATTGLSLTDEDYHKRNPHKAYKAVGTRGVSVCFKPVQVEVTDNQFGGESTYDKTMRAIETSVLYGASQEFPFYGMEFYWYHPNLSGNAGQVLQRFTIDVEIQWNTVWDTSLQAIQKNKDIKASEIQQSMSGQPCCVQPVGVDLHKPQLFYPILTDDKKEYEMPELKRNDQQSSVPNSKPVVKDRPLPPSRPPTPTKSR